MSMADLLNRGDVMAFLEIYEAGKAVVRFNLKPTAGNNELQVLSIVNYKQSSGKLDTVKYEHDSGDVEIISADQGTKVAELRALLERLVFNRVKLQWTQFFEHLGDKGNQARYGLSAVGSTRLKQVPAVPRCRRVPQQTEIGETTRCDAVCSVM